MKAARDSSKRAWNQRAQRLGPNAFALLDGSGAAGVVTSLWSAGWGSTRSSAPARAPSP
ncbi:MAG: hypothetical protein IPN16_23085 [Gemmatimonadetes bacterium]|nr:hypothetical protein [Gemmatimonadota bacterium]